MSRRHGQTTDGGDVTGERQFERARGEIPNFYDTVPSAGGKPRVSRLDGDAADPAQMARDDADEFPGWVVGRFDGTRRLVEDECFGELVRGGECRGLCFGCVVDGGDHARGVGRCWWVELVAVRRGHAATYDRR